MQESTVHSNLNAHIEKEILTEEVRTGTLPSDPYLPVTDEIYAKVQEALEQVRPFLQSDGGDADLIGIRTDLSVDLKLVGACGSCPMSAVTLKNGVEQIIMRNVPEVTKVNAI